MNKQEFIEKSTKIYGDKYDYSMLPETLTYKEKVKIICPIDGIFEKTVGNHLNGQGCPKCAIRKRNKVYDRDEFIRRANIIHNNRYDYSKVDFVNTRTKVCIIDPENGEFWQTPNSHLAGHGCKRSIENKQKDFIREAKKIHGNRYDYSRVEFINKDTNVTIICPIHGTFQQTPYNHLLGHGCQACSGNKKLTTEDFIRRAKEVHGNKYDYSKTEYIDNKTKVCIICPEHGEFWQTPGHHLSGEGCYRCGRKISSEKQILTTEEFIKQATAIHGNKYDYSKVVYTGYENYVEIICPIHGPFMQSPDSHLHSGGCPRCGSTLSKNEDELYNYLKELVGEENIEQRNRTILWNKELDIYIPDKKIAIEYDGLYWHSERNPRMNKEYHLNKTLLCEEKGVRLIHIFEDEYVLHKEIVLNKLKHILGLNNNCDKIPARKCIVKEINKHTAELFLNTYHIQGFVRGTVHLGCFYNNQLIAVMSFTKEIKNSKKWELTRFASDYHYICQGVGGKLFKYFIKNYVPEEIKSFADRRWSVAKENIYTKLGFSFETFSKPDYYYYNEKNDVYGRIHKFNFRKQILHKKYNLDITKTESKMAEELNYVKIWNCGLIKYVWKKIKQ